MNEKRCPQCQSPVDNDLPGGMCPTCLMEVARNSMNPGDATIQHSSADEGNAPTVERMQTLFPELEIMDLVGQGGMGAVYRARQKSLDRLVALKVFLFRPDDLELSERFAREARALAKLSHPNIITVHDFGERDQLRYLVMEYVDGLNLRQLSRDETLSPTQALELVPQLCDALQYAHDHGVVHRDIKPENVMVDSLGRVKVADFGLAKLTNAAQNADLTHTRQVMGTWNYMAPEQRDRPTEVDHRADIYSLGVVIYELLTRELPVGRFPMPSEKAKVTSELDEVVMRALEREPDRRYQQASEFKTGLQSAWSQPQVARAVAAESPLPPKPAMDGGLANASARGEQGSLHGEIFMLAYHVVAIGCCVASGIVFAAFRRIPGWDRDETNLLGILVAMLGAFLLASTGFVRILIRARPGDDEPDDQACYDESSRPAALLNMLGMFLAIGTGAVFVYRHYVDSNSWFLLAVGIGCGASAGLVFAIAGKVEELRKRFGRGS